MKTKIGIPIGLALVMFLGVFAAMLAFGTLSPQPAQAQTAMRTISPMPVEPGGTVTVTIAVSGYGQSGGLTETLPAGFTYTGTTHPAGQVTHPLNNDDQMVRFTLFGETSVEYTATAPGAEGGPHTFMGTLLDFDRNSHTIDDTSVMVSTAPVVIPMMVGNFMVDNTVKRPGDVSGFRFTFTTDRDLVANEDTITVHFDKDFKGHGSNLSMNHVTVSARHAADATIADTVMLRQTGAYNPSTDATRNTLSTAHPVSHANAVGWVDDLTNNEVLGNIEYLISVPDMNGGEDGAPGIAAGSTVTLTISPAAGITNATEGGNKGPLGVYTSEQPHLVYGRVLVVRGIGLNDYDANRGKALTVIGRGFQNGTTASVYLVRDATPDVRGCDFSLDPNAANFNQAILDGATELVSEPVASDDTFQATFTVTVPPFAPGFGNCIYAQDGNDPPFSAGPVEFELEGLLTVSPTSAAVGDKVDITLEDWKGSIPAMTFDSSGNLLTSPVDIADVPQRILGNPTISNYSANFQIEISTATPSGTNEIRVRAGESDDKKITISGAILNASPMTAVPNQAITVNGQGFSGDGTINAANDRSEVRLGGDDAALGSSDRNFNNGESITVDSGGSWSATIIVPITGATTTPGTHELEVTDSGNRSGSVEITIPPRVLTIEPAEARPGETVTLTGSGFPASNTRSKEHSTPSIQITYDGELVGTAIPDGSGNIQLSFRVPLGSSHSLHQPGRSQLRSS